MSEHEEDFAALFEASVKPRRFDRGQTIAGVVVGIGPKVAFVSVGGKSEAQIDIEELKDADGDVEGRSAIASKRWSSRPAEASSSRARACAMPRRSASWKTRSGPGSRWKARWRER